MKWIKRIIGFIKLYKDYEYEPEVWRHIVETYTQILCLRTHTMSKPTYYIRDILNEIDIWYEEHDEQVRADERAQHKYLIKADGSIHNLDEDIEKARADERAKVLDEFEARLEKHQQDNWVDNLEYGITFADIDEVIEEMKRNK